MSPFLRCFYYMVLSLSMPSNILCIQNKYREQLNDRVKRQDGYVYGKPNISFDLPRQSTIEPTQAPTVDRTLMQQMFYSYPTPVRGDTNAGGIDNTAGSDIGAATSTPTADRASGYNYKSSATDNTSNGYNYGRFGSPGAQGNIGAQITSTTSQTIATNSQSATSMFSQTNSGYSNNLPSPAFSPSLPGPSELSTSAPRYLPPTIGDNESSRDAGSITKGGLSGQVATGPEGVLSDSYLPPLSNNAVSTGQANGQSNLSGSVPVRNTGYLPPIQGPSPIPSNNSQGSTLPGDYLPPSNIITNSATVSSTPASKYLPPGFF